MAAKAEAAPWPWLSRWRAKERSAASWRMSERLSTPSRRRAARNARMSRGLSATRTGLAEVACRKSEELAQIAAVSLDGFGREAPFARQHGEPSGCLALDIRRAGT